MKKIGKYKKKKSKGTWEFHNGQVRYLCSQCNTREDIPAEVVNLFDVLDPGDPLVPPRFSCEKCGGAM